ncbi:MAG: hypothetical protein ACREM3_30270 [Candidatus Rokuibacteriota bacterium]
MGEAIGVLILVLAMIVGPLVWRVAKDRREERAQWLEAEIRSAIREALGGESLLAVRVEPRTALHAGRVMLSTPHGWESLIEPVWKKALASTPEDYELVITPGGGAAEAEAVERRAA